jgi:aspartyl-tRNA synthetase
MQRILNAETKKYINETVKVCGWVDSRRDHGKIIFIDLKDRSGLLQIVFVPQNEKAYSLAQDLRPEWVVSVEGKIVNRPPAMINPKIETGKVELQAENLEIFSKAKTLPFEISGRKEEVNEEIRMKYRYLDLRRPKMKSNLILRQKIVNFIRDFLTKEGFIEIETPILTKSTPEGARDYIVPSRNQPGKFYALPQSPQQYKQLLMVAGFEKYFQIARCFRDEDPRGDRQPEFTQLDLEMAFIDQNDILDLTERLFIEIVKNLAPEKEISQIPFPRITYKEAMEKYNSDKPDLRKNKSNANELAFAFVVDFPMFEWKKEEKRWDAIHHPFTRPQIEDIKKIKENPEKILAYQYDFVLNGYEIGGGSLRTYKPEILEAVFEVMGHKKQDIRQKFGHLLEAFEYGVPPHGGIAPGIDRFLMILAGEPSIREVIAFPKTGDGRDLMMGAPSEVEESQLKELRIKIERPKAKKKKNKK